MSTAKHTIGQRGPGSRREATTTGFTLVEILIVVVILGILASIVIPQFSNASLQTRENVLRDELRYLRTQVQVYRAQHRDVSPGYPGGNASTTPTSAAFTSQMTLYSDDVGNTSASYSSTYKYGPYLSKIPPNPLNNLSTITVVANGASIPTIDGTTGWIYKAETQEFLANVNGSDLSGTPYGSY